MTMGVFSENIKGEAGRGPLSCYGNEREAQNGASGLAPKAALPSRGSGFGGAGPPAMPHPCVPHTHRGPVPLLTCMSAQVCSYLVINKYSIPVRRNRKFAKKV